MKAYFIVAVLFAVLAIVLVEINAQREDRHRRCSERERPPINSTEVKCDKRPGFGATLGCAIKCRQCYNRTELNKIASCLVNRKCHCLRKPENGTVSTTPGSETEAPTTVSDGPVSGETTLPSVSTPSTPSGGELTTPGNIGISSTSEQSGGDLTTPANDGGDLTT